MGLRAARWRCVVQVAALALAAAPPSPPAPPRPRLCRSDALCFCRDDHFACSQVPFHRFPQTDARVWHVSVSEARLGALGEAALDARRLRTLVLVASHLHHIDSAALASMVSTLASLDLGYNEFTEVPIESLRGLKVLNWLNMQNNYISEIDPKMDWGFLSDSLSTLSLSNNYLSVLPEGTLSSLRQLAQLELDGNRLRMLAPGALPASLALLRVSDNLLYWPCAAAMLPRLRHLHLRNNLVGSTHNHTCFHQRSRIDSLDMSHNELDDYFDLEYLSKFQLKQLVLDMNDFTIVPLLPFDNIHLEKLSISHNRIAHVPDAVIHALKRDLERLDLDNNELASLPSSIKDMVRLRYLSVAYNKLEEVADLPPHLYSLSAAGNYLSSFPAALSELTPGTLGYLDLGYNRISAVSRDEFGAWASALGTLSLRGNRLSQLTTDAFPALPLRELALSFNDLYYVEPDSLAALSDLQVLDLSSALFSGEFPLRSPLGNVSWLTLDNNNIHMISSEDIYNFRSLEYLNLDFNKIVEFPSEINDTSKYYKLKELRLSYNYINKVNSNYLTRLSELQSVDLSYNRMQNISERSFASLRNLVVLSLAGNLLELVADGAFFDLPKLEVLDLQENHLVEFSTEYFRNVSSENGDFAVNVSYNRLTWLVGSSSVSICVLDLSHNLLEILPRSFFHSLSSSIRQIILAHNRLMHIDNFSFGSLPKLQILNLNNNNISSVKRRTFIELSALQILDLSHNKLTQLSIEQFHNMRRLRHLRLDCNELRALPRDCFKNTVLEHLDLSDNQLVMFPSSALSQVGFTLHRLELAGNRLEYLDAAMFHATSFLHELGLARNALTVLSDNTFAALSRLARLNLSHNAIKTNFKELFHNLPRLRRLTLAGAGLKVVPHLPLMNLTHLDLNSNQITSFRENDVRRLTNLRTLDVSYNKITSLQPAMWTALAQLNSLDVSYNPIVRITRGAFDGLSRLTNLKMEHIWHLEAIEPRAFRSLASLRSVTLETPAGGMTLAAVAACVPGLEEVTLSVRASALDAQLHGLRAPKLRALEVRGAALRRVSAHAFMALGGQRVLSLRLTRTGVRSLPAGLVRPLARVPHLALDFSHNRLDTFAPATLYPNLTGWNRLATKLLPGGLVVSDNPLRCGCLVSWVGAWLRRWAAEAGAWGAGARAAARRGACRAAGGARVPLLALDADDADCQVSALSARASLHHAHSLQAFVWIVLLHSLS